MQGQADQQVLRLHAYHAVLVRRQREVDCPAGDIGAHRVRIVELQGEEREDALHAAVVDLATGPQLVQDGGRFGVEADVPRPVRLVDAADRLHYRLQVEEVRDPGLDYACERIQRRTAVGQADHRVVARLALPVDTGIRPLEHIQVDRR